MKKTKKLISVFLSLAVLTGSFCALISAGAADDVAINETTFPDPIWRQVVTEFYDTNSDGILSADERNVTRMSVAGMILDVFDEEEPITDLKGIEHFTSLTSLNCGGIHLQTLDVSAITGLKTLSCQGNDLKTLNVDYNYNLETLICNANELTSLKVSLNTSLVKLHCYENKIASLDLSNLTRLQDFNCYSNELTSLNLTNCGVLANLHCSFNHLKSLDLSSNNLLTDLTDKMIGSQTVGASASYDSENEVFTVPFTVADASKVSFTNADFFDSTSFTTADYDVLKEGIVYNYNVNAGGSSEDMSVTITPIEKSFFAVDFVSDSEGTTLLKREIVNSGESATSPEVDAPEHRYLASWSEPFDNVTQDVVTYPIWNEGYSVSGKILALSSPSDATGKGGVVSGATITIGNQTATAAENGTYTTGLIDPGTYTATVSSPYSIDREFTITIGSKDQTNVNVAIVNCDRNKDGYINARDYRPGKDSLTAQEKSNMKAFFAVKNFKYPTLSYS